jgi:2-C-methyl-D-erythritol 2,4-cyclodiphosphate synthase
VTTTRAGIGYDSHRFAAGGPLILGGVAIHGDVHLEGHSDGDAVAHAVTDAILGAAGLGDIGELFPDDDQANAGRDSLEMLELSAAKVVAAGWHVVGIDVVVVTERPRILTHRSDMRRALAGALSLPESAVSLKGKSNEGMGWIGRGEGLACIAVATVAGSPR